MAENLPSSKKWLTDGVASVFSDTVDQLIVDLGRPVVLYMEPSASGCPNCSIGFDGSSNGVYNASNPFGAGPYNRSFPTGGVCPVCKGSQKILTTVSVTYTANVNRAPKDFEAAAEGIDPQNVYKTKMQLCAWHDILRTKKALIDGLMCERIRDPIKTGMRTLGRVVCWWKKID